MINRFEFLKAKESVAADEYDIAVRQQLVPALLKMKHLKRCEVHAVTDRSGRGTFPRGEYDVDYFVETWFDDMISMQEGFASLDQAALADVRQLSEPIASYVTAKRETPAVPRVLYNKDLIHSITLATFLEGVGAERFQHEWWGRHAALVNSRGGYVGYNQNIVLDRYLDGVQQTQQAMPLAGVVEFFFLTPEAYSAAYNDIKFHQECDHAHSFIGTTTPFNTATTRYLKSVDFGGMYNPDEY